MWLIRHRTVTAKFKWRFDLEIRIRATDSISFYPHGSLGVWIDRGLPLEVLEAATYRLPVWCWKDTWRDLEEVQNWPLQMPLCSLLFGGGQELSLGGYRFPGILIKRGEQIEMCILDLESGCLLSLQVLSCNGVRDSTGWQSFKYVSHSLQHHSGYRHFCETRHSRWVLKRQFWSDPPEYVQGFDRETIRSPRFKKATLWGLSIFLNFCIFFPALFWSCGSQISAVFLFMSMKKGERSDTVNGAGKRKATVEEKGKRASHRTRIGMDFDPKTSKLRD